MKYTKKHKYKKNNTKYNKRNITFRKINIENIKKIIKKIQGSITIQPTITRESMA